MLTSLPPLLFIIWDKQITESAGAANDSAGAETALMESNTLWEINANVSKLCKHNGPSKCRTSQNTVSTVLFEKWTAAASARFPSQKVWEI